MRYKQVISGEWVSPRRSNYYLKCCDCGLVHRMDFRLVPTLNGGRKIQMRAFRLRKRGGHAS